MAEGSSAGTGAGGEGTAQGQASAQTASQTSQAPKTEGTQQKAGQPETKETRESIEKTEVVNEGEKEKKPETEKEAEKKKHRYADRLSQLFPDRKFEKDEDYDTALDEHLTGLEEYKKRGTEANKKLIALFESQPEVGSLVKDMINGATFREALARHISPEDLTPIEGDPDYEGWVKNKKEREDSLAKRREREAQRERDLAESQAVIEAFAKENNMDDAAAEAFLKKVDEMIGAITSGKVSKEALIAMQRAFNYENDIARAKEEGALSERNKKIVAEKEKPEKKGDGIPRPAISGGQKETVEVKPTYIDGLLEKVNKRKVLGD